MKRTLIAVLLVLASCGDAGRPDIPVTPTTPDLTVEVVASNTERSGGWRIVEVDRYRCVMFTSWEFGGGLWCEYR